MPNVLPVPALQAPQFRFSTAKQSRPLSTLVPLLAVFYSFLLLTPEAELSAFGVNLPAYRQAALLMSVPALWIMSRDRQGTPGPMDYAVILIGFWIILSFMTIYGVQSGLVRGAGIVIDTALVYMIARASVRTPDELRHFLLLCLPGLMFAGGMLALESISGQLLMRPFFASIFGSMNFYTGGEANGTLSLGQEYRLGLMRAYGPFPHPILAGAVMIGFLPLFYFSGIRSWPYIIGIGVALCGFFSLSSAAFLAMMLAGGAILIYYIKPYFPKITWWTIVSMLGLLVSVVHFSAQNGIIPVIARLTLTPHTAEYRRLIWEFGSISVTNHPWFGLGYQQWERPIWMAGESVDAHFLLLAMRHGLFVPVVLLAGMIYGMVRLGLVMPRLSPRERALMVGLNITVFVYLVVGQTVNFFGSSGLVFMTMVAFLASMVGWANDELHLQNRVRLMLHRGRLHGSAV